MHFGPLMLTRINLVLALSVLLISFTAHSQEQDPSKIFEQAKIEMDKGSLKKSLSLFQEVDSIHPDLPNVVWNIGTLALMLGYYDLANQSWMKMEELEPKQWRVLGKLAQATKGKGDMVAFNKHRKELVGLHKDGKDPDLAKQERFLVEQIPMLKGRIFIYQYFSPLSGEYPLFYQAVLVDEDSLTLVRTSLGSYNATNEIHKALTPGANTRMYHFDLYENDGSHMLLDMQASEHPIEYENAVLILVNAIKKWIKAHYR